MVHVGLPLAPFCRWQACRNVWLSCEILKNLVELFRLAPVIYSELSGALVPKDTAQRLRIYGFPETGASVAQVWMGHDPIKPSLGGELA